MTATNRVVCAGMFGLLTVALISVPTSEAANGRRPSSGVVGTFGQLGATNPRRAGPSRAQRRPGAGNSLRGGGTANGLGNVAATAGNAAMKRPAGSNRTAPGGPSGATPIQPRSSFPPANSQR